MTEVVITAFLKYDFLQLIRTTFCGTTSQLMTPSPLQNYLLFASPLGVQQRLFPKLELVTLKLKEILFERGEIMQYVYFPIDSIVASLYELENGSSTEISIIGNDGVIGISLCLKVGSNLNRGIVQSAGCAYRLHRKPFLNEFNRYEEFMHLLLRYTQALITQIAQTTVCNRHHKIEQQLCRWILLILDRLPNNKLNMTHNLISDMLGVRRESITQAAKNLQKLGAIDYVRGQITVLDRPKIEQLCCECYEVVKKETERLLPFVLPP